MKKLLMLGLVLINAHTAFGKKKPRYNSNQRSKAFDDAKKDHPSEITNFVKTICAFYVTDPKDSSSMSDNTFRCDPATGAQFSIAFDDAKKDHPTEVTNSVKTICTFYVSNPKDSSHMSGNTFRCDK